MGSLFLYCTTLCCHSCKRTVLKENKQPVAILHLQKTVDEQKHLVFISYSSGYFWCVISSDQHYKIFKAPHKTEHSTVYPPIELSSAMTVPVVLILFQGLCQLFSPGKKRSTFNQEEPSLVYYAAFPGETNTRNESVCPC